MSSSNDFNRQTDALKAQASETVRKVGDQINQHANVIRDVTATARYNTQEFIENNPWQSVLMATAAGFLLGYALTRRR